MVQIQNPEAAEAIKKGAGITQSEGVPQVLSGTAIPVIDMTPDFHRVADTRGTGSAGTIITTPTDVDFYLTGCELEGDKTAAQTGTLLAITATINGVVRAISQVPTQTLTAESKVHAREFTVPIKIDPGTAITFTVSGTWTQSIAIINFFTAKRI